VVVVGRGRGDDDVVVAVLVTAGLWINAAPLGWTRRGRHHREGIVVESRKGLDRELEWKGLDVTI
jgi:hypothetical protein